MPVEDGETLRDTRSASSASSGTSRGDRFFDPFFSTKEGAGHHGLGMFVCREIIRHHEGRITVESRVGAGSTVTVTLPFHP